jgi:hypothetical protein
MKPPIAGSSWLPFKSTPHTSFLLSASPSTLHRHFIHAFFYDLRPASQDNNSMLRALSRSTITATTRLNAVSRSFGTTATMNAQASDPDCIFCKIIKGRNTSTAPGQHGQGQNTHHIEQRLQRLPDRPIFHCPTVSSTACAQPLPPSTRTRPAHHQLPSLSPFLPCHTPFPQFPTHFTNPPRSHQPTL